jgi:phenylpyruvate tautomerase PptA (4-oxalocrotonate tautomerase family)
MPIVDVQLVAKGSIATEGSAARLAEALGQVFSAPPGRVWVRLSVLPVAQYAENGINAAETGLPVFVRVLHADLPSGHALATQAAGISHAVAACLQCSAEHVHVEYAPAGRGRVAFGGQLLA